MATRSKFSTTFLRLALTVAVLIATAPAYAQQGEDLREAAQNPIADLISVPFQNNTNFDIGRSENTQNVLNFQPVYPLHLNQSWNLITRPILPVISQPPFFSGRELAAAEEIFGPGIGDTEFGLGDLTPEFFFSPRKAGIPIRYESMVSARIMPAMSPEPNTCVFHGMKAFALSTMGR